jgi:NAD(P)-dependent dehydrogenase (short-subunit alcohol dehydrogenase family)
MPDRKAAVVTGAAQGIGQAYAVRLAEEGVDVAIADLQPADETAELVRAAGARAVTLRCDVTSEEDVDAFAEAVRGEFGRCDILVNNAGIYPFDTFESTTFQQWRRVLAVSLDASFLMAKAFVPMMRANRWGRVVNVSSSEIWLVNRICTTSPPRRASSGSPAHSRPRSPTTTSR